MPAKLSGYAIYQDYAHLYDHIAGDRSAQIRLLKNIIDIHMPGATQVLELACGTGSVIAGLQSSYKITGLDFSKSMLSIAKRKVPDSTMYLADMTDFHLGQKFDAIYCVQSSMNHLLPIEKWTSVFHCVDKQLKKDGVFIFDVDTTYRMEVLMSSGLQFYPASRDHRIITKTSKHPHIKERYQFEIRIFERKNAYSFTYIPTVIETSVFSETDIVKTVIPDFKILDIINLHGKHRLQDLHRTYFVCRKK